MYDAGGARRVVVEPNPVWWVDMRLLGARLRADALAAGALGLFEHRCIDVVVTDGRPRQLRLRGPKGPVELTARLFVDAAGLGGPIRRAVPAFEPFCPKPKRADMCSAAQAVCVLADRAAAQRFLAEHQARPGEVLSFSGVAGGYSIQNVQVDLDGGVVDLLTGAIALPEHPSGPALIEDLKARLPWIGPTRFGGSGAVPLRRAYARLGAPGVALLGDAGCQVYSAHGSGIGMGMLAAKALCDAVAGAPDPGAEAVTWDYSARFHRTWGARNAVATLVRRMTQRLSTEAVAQVLKAGLITPEATAATLDHQLPPLGPSQLPKVLLGAARAPRLAARLLGQLRHLPTVVRHHRRYPNAVDVAALQAWDRRLGQLLD
jgi:flavin-dependent dehydrogenase